MCVLGVTAAWRMATAEPAYFYKILKDVCWDYQGSHFLCLPKHNEINNYLVITTVSASLLAIYSFRLLFIIMPAFPPHQH